MIMIMIMIMMMMMMMMMIMMSVVVVMMMMIMASNGCRFILFSCPTRKSCLFYSHADYFFVPS